MMRRTLLVVLGGMLMTAVSTTGQQNGPEPGGDVSDHVAWLLAVFEGDPDALGSQAIDRHFVPGYLNSENATRFIERMQLMAEAWGPLALVENTTRVENSGRFSGVFETRDGQLINVAIVVDAESGRIVALMIGPPLQEIDPRWMPVPTQATPTHALAA